MQHQFKRTCVCAVGAGAFVACGVPYVPGGEHVVSVRIGASTEGILSAVLEKYEIDGRTIQKRTLEMGMNGKCKKLPAGTKPDWY